jgi:hypothetical protein
MKERNLLQLIRIYSNRGLCQEKIASKDLKNNVSPEIEFFFNGNLSLNRIRKTNFEMIFHILKKRF